MSVKVIDNTIQVITRNDQNASTAVRLMLEDIWRTSRPKTPYKAGNLSKDVLRTVNGKKGSISWTKRYAAAQEVGTVKGSPIKHYTTPGTGKHFAEDSVKEVVKNSDQYFKKANQL